MHTAGRSQTAFGDQSLPPVVRALSVCFNDQLEPALSPVHALEAACATTGPAPLPCAPINRSGRPPCSALAVNRAAPRSLIAGCGSSNLPEQDPERQWPRTVQSRPINARLANHHWLRYAGTASRNELATRQRRADRCSPSCPGLPAWSCPSDTLSRLSTIQLSVPEANPPLHARPPRRSTASGRHASLARRTPHGQLLAPHCRPTTLRQPTQDSVERSLRVPMAACCARSGRPFWCATPPKREPGLSFLSDSARSASSPRRCVDVSAGPRRCMPGPVPISPRSRECGGGCQ